MTCPSSSQTLLLTLAHELFALVPKLVKHLVERGVVWAYFHVRQLVEHGVQEMLVRVEGAFMDVNHSIVIPRKT